jgi:hypothetical protein
VKAPRLLLVVAALLLMLWAGRSLLTEGVSEDRQIVPPRTEVDVDVERTVTQRVRVAAPRTAPGGPHEPTAQGAGDTSRTGIRVVDINGVPIPGALVQLTDNDPPNSQGITGTEPAGADGVVDYSYVKNGKLIAQGYPPRKRHADLLPGKAALVLGKQMDLVLEPALHIRGLVVYATGAPVAYGAFAYATDAWGFYFGTHEIYSDESGRFDIGGLEPGETLFMAPGAQRSRENGRHPEFAAPDTFRILEVVAGATDVRLELREGSTLEVEVLGGAEGGRYWIRAIAEDGWSVGEHVRDGRALITGLVPGQPNSLLVRDQESKLAAHASGIRGGGRLTLRLEPGIELRGTVTSEHPFLKYIEMHFVLHGCTFDIDVEDDGSFVLHNVPPVPGTLTGRSWGGGHELAGSIDATPGILATLELRRK